MRVAINTRFLLPSKMEGFGWYTYEIVSRITNNNPECEFVLFLIDLLILNLFLIQMLNALYCLLKHVIPSYLFGGLNGLLDAL